MKNYYKIISILLSVIMIFSLGSCQNNQPDNNQAPEEEQKNLVNTTVQGESQGKYGPIKVEVVIENSEIKGINILENSDSGYTNTVVDSIISHMIETNSTDADTVTGATLTSGALIRAVSDAVKQANVTLTAKNVVKEVETAEDASTDIVIVGAGGAGMTAAIEATNQGSNVIVVEKNAFIGGNTNYATGGMNAAGTKYQEEKGIEDSPELFYEDTMKGGHDLNDPELLKVFTEKSAETLDWLESLGADLSEVGRSGGQSVDRLHKAPQGMPIGSHLMDVFQTQADNLGIEIRLNTKAIEILTDDNGSATGIKVENNDGNTYNINAKAVIIATGGFGANAQLVEKYNPELKGFGTTNQPGATGDALAMAEKLDVALTDIDQIQTHPTVVPVINEMITEGIRGDGAILVNHEGKRFIDELETRDVVSEAILSQEGATAFLVLDKQVYEKASTYEKYKNQGLLKEAASIEELAQMMEVDASELKNTIESYNVYVTGKSDTEFGRTSLDVELTQSPYYYVEVAPAIHHTMGGLKINTNTEVINNSGDIIPGLFAAGEVTGGIHGGNRIGGNAVSDITIFGRIAGASASTFVK
ncbi:MULTISPECIES: flavocytochrome c [unclassified Sedimentibacter]|uniref:flavocytochrome c n=1 Tax=unclassified Sedimentibacter TaxID=2649220 RepID=UPI0027E083EB|nr:flavocytochrome c [Sedimentibacter sp. MB35-C1]WMJ78334.1 flavocytochrome c [Sedimentibacter sp. MB35-C1]